MRHLPDWNEVLSLFDEHEQRIRQLSPTSPMPDAEFCRQSAHRTLGHLTACQLAWIPLLRRIRENAQRGTIVEHPLRLFESLGYSTKPWKELLNQFLRDRLEWRELLSEVDLDQPLKTPTRVHTAKTLTEKLVRHESGHLNDLKQDSFHLL